MATYNGGRYIREQLESILSQLNADDELVISDDGSTDDTLSAIESCHDGRIKLFRNELWHGVVGNFENAIKRSKGSIIFLSDQDDVWCQNKLATMIPMFEKYDVVVSDCFVTDRNLNVLINSKFATDGIYINPFRNIVKCTLLGSCMAFKRELIPSFLPFPNSKYVYHDLWIGITAGARYNFGVLRKQTMFYRRHESTVSSTGNKDVGEQTDNQNSLLHKICKRVAIVYYYFRWFIRVRNNAVNI